MIDPTPTRETALALVSGLQQEAERLAVALRAPPPEPVGCCGRGCNGCVWEGYFGAIGWWQEDALLALAQATPAGPDRPAADQCPAGATARDAASGAAAGAADKPASPASSA